MTQTLNPNLTSSIVDIDDNGEVVYLSKLTEVVGTDNQVIATVTDSKVQLGLPNALQVETVTATKAFIIPTFSTIAEAITAANGASSIARIITV